MSLSLRIRVLLSLVVPSGVFLVAAGVLASRLSSSALEQQLGNSQAALAQGIASTIPVSRLINLTAEDTLEGGSRTYRHLHDLLSGVVQRTHLRRVVAFNRAGEVLIDVGGNLPVGELFPDIGRDRAELETVWAGEAVASSVLFRDLNGTYYKTGYAPLRDENAVVGAIAVEGNAALFAPLRRLWFGQLSLTVLMVIVAAGLAIVVARSVTRPLGVLLADAKRIGQGTLGVPIQIRGAGEIATLAEALERMRQALETRSQTMNLMLGGIAHEVKNPLGGMSLFIGLADEELQNSAPNLVEVRGHLQRSKGELDYLQRIVDDFLGFARDQPIHSENFDVAALVNQAIEHVAADAEAKSVTLTIALKPATLVGDLNLLTSAVVNLCKNAVQASPVGGEVSVTGRPSGQQYHLDFHDTGPTIAPEVAAHIFEPFYTTRAKGTGLGLPLARKICEANGGSLQLLANDMHKVFRVVLPLSPSTANT